MTRDLSIIVPTFNEEERIIKCLIRLSVIFPREIIVVDNGSSDNTKMIVGRLIKLGVFRDTDLRLIQMPKPGKGAAVRMGMILSRGAYCYMADCDLSTPASAILDFLIFMRNYKADVVLGSRRMPGSKVKQSARRAFSAKIFHAFTSLLLPEIHDTQCGFKLFSRQAAQDIFSKTRLDGLAFDVEVILEAKQLGYKVMEMPVPWDESSRSSVHLVRDGMKMTRDLFSLARRYRFKRAAQLRPSLP